MTRQRKEDTAMRTTSRNRIAFAVSLACGLFVALAVGAFAGGNSSTPALEPTLNSKGGVRATEVMVALNGRAANAEDPVTQGARRALEELTKDEPGVSADQLPGTASQSRARTLVTGGSGLRLVGAPTSKGRVCAVLMNRGDVLVSGGCVEEFTEALPVVPLVTTLAGEPAIVSGLVSDSVDAIAIVADGVGTEARIRNNAFVFQLASASVAPTAVRAILTDGSTVTVDLPQMTIG
jgi:hypothetical protein